MFQSRNSSYCKLGLASALAIIGTLAFSGTYSFALIRSNGTPETTNKEFSPAYSGQEFKIAACRWVYPCPARGYLYGCWIC
ncbi:hypothetical protein QUB80_12525 [Chlorogloeopsis sp. ULAP01]|uniref:hypothetical protein n=1 Tax=Chlorogloeopsis sp. ULAP01 TaxID=3056483 RepID=UPI0025AA3326|nr:hypothetical protein [Chlorogloeopsis sp. ULAP01]MDM9381526.1 hypothetical protein [Chlorogloeopsis sp. ULAP01]